MLQTLTYEQGAVAIGFMLLNWGVFWLLGYVFGRGHEQYKQMKKSEKVFKQILQRRSDGTGQTK
jgi:hypothetical protein